MYTQAKVVNSFHNMIIFVTKIIGHTTSAVLGEVVVGYANGLTRYDASDIADFLDLSLVSYSVLDTGGLIKFSSEEKVVGGGGGSCTAQKRKFSIKDFFSKCDQNCSFLRIWSHLLNKSLMENFIFCAVLLAQNFPSKR